MENYNQNYDQNSYNFEYQDTMTLTEIEEIYTKGYDYDQFQEDFIDAKYETSAFRNENIPNEERIINEDDLITNDEEKNDSEEDHESDELDYENDLEKDGDLDDNDALEEADEHFPENHPRE
ncbi:hypothetical protein [Flavobacterium reichenbachii]|uniref:hypothetical protein n=1 Tax=Flavobacterium reichenbachii TaxID=362418 RepID=UPI00068C11DC|nr:hypothetical protein [Flavobacterium reichenbachii]OXB15712.1 hypothetical protein B0A68_10000 [Flavobacterium reichenbachii]